VPRPNWSDAFSPASTGWQFPPSHIGRPGLVEGTREFVEAAYIIVYMVDETADEITVLAIVHGARDREA
jgi:plasmid stabilization system protein ParE